MCIPAGAFAQDADPPLIKNEETKDPLEVHGNEILVLSPRIRGQIDVPQQPVQVFEEEDIASYGANSIADLLDAISPQTTSGRGRGSGRPVILVNGQRITSFREMRNIPPEAIRRMEVLPEEVALRFGYPANQRVVNIILKDQFAAATASGEYNRPDRGGYDNFELESGLFKISGPRRYNVTAKLDETTMLTEAERNVRQAESDAPLVAGDPDPARYRSLKGSNHKFTLEGTMTQGLGENGLGGSLTASGGYTHTQSASWSGLDTALLTYGGQSVLRTLPDPLTSRIVSDEFDASLGFSTMLGDWTLNVTGDGSYTDTNTRVDRRRDTSALEDAAAAGDLALDGALPFVPGAGVDIATNRALSLTSLATLSGQPFRMPAGDASLTVKTGYDFSRTRSDDSRNTLGAVTLRRGDVQGGLNLALPLTSDEFLGAVGDISLNFSGGLDHLSDFGTLKDWSAGLTWSPTDTLTFQASYLVDEAAPSLSQLGAPVVESYNVAIYDFDKAETALVTVTTGGNPNLRKEKQRDIKLSAQWKLPFFRRSSLIAEYFRNRSSNVTQSFPLLTPAIEQAFQDRVERDRAGNLTAIDRRAVTYDEVSSSSLRWGINLWGSLGSDSAPASRREPAAAPPPVRPENRSPDGAGPGEGRSRFEAVRKQLCTPGAEPDLSTLPERLRSRLAGPDGKPDPEKLAQFRARACSVDGSAAPRFDPEQFARIRKAVCTGETPDLAALPERMAERLRGEDGKIDQARLAQMRERMCRADNGAGAAQSGEARGQTASRAPGGGGMRRPGPPRGGRWNISVYHTWRFTDRVTIAPGVPVLDQLAGNAIGSGGVGRHAIEFEGGMFKNGFGLRIRGEWNAPSRVLGTGLPGSSDLRFGAYTVANVRLFVDLDQRKSLIDRVPFLKGTRVSFTVDRLFDSRQKVTDQNGEVPIAYQAAFREPLGRVIGIDLRKRF
ncbi:TonB-dependent receptor plug domain-containing protein [Novosphingobium beihaiensis]|uniref:TonB-dependent receptor n=1 Tax=Novosphingobium beihaiensis TaxID=2930389 RepID=A0ABT0BT11_9SPHN|nr:TonB-dependent receptor [Novosphingobium beihaiensis]MCJ2188203.1 TonB-dependent receptor [Novosphingobium beihaiensis]